MCHPSELKRSLWDMIQSGGSRPFMFEIASSASTAHISQPSINDLSFLVRLRVIRAFALSIELFRDHHHEKKGQDVSNTTRLQHLLLHKAAPAVALVLTPREAAFIADPLFVDWEGLVGWFWFWGFILLISPSNYGQPRRSR